MDRTLAPGRIVHYVESDGRSPGECRPLVITKPWNGKMVNGTLLEDFGNDREPLQRPVRPESSDELMYHDRRLQRIENAQSWKTSVQYDPRNTKGTFHFHDECLTVWPAATWELPVESLPPNDVTG